MVQFIRTDLDFILAQIKISKRTRQVRISTICCPIRFFLGACGPSTAATTTSCRARVDGPRIRPFPASGPDYLNEADGDNYAVGAAGVRRADDHGTPITVSGSVADADPRISRT
jgi:hypothetical protein